MTPAPDRFSIQDSEYSFPYHYIPAAEPFALHRRLRWGLEYMTYLSFVSDLIAQRGPASLLDVGCGDGRLLFEVAQHVEQRAGVDLSRRAADFARAFNPDADIRCAPVASMDGVFEVITLIEVLEHIPDDSMPGFLAGVWDRLAPGGLLIVCVPTVNKALQPKHYRHYDLKSARATLQPLFDIEGQWWLYQHDLLEKVIRNLLCNRLLILNSERGRELLWRVHRRFNYFGDEKTGTHLVLTAKKR
jgi:SAM-dependent methyltransferase